jgi:hypothetical protein
LFAVWTLFVSLPLWYVLLYQLLLAAGVETWVWVIFFGYMPVSMIGVLLSGLVHIVEEL